MPQNLLGQFQSIHTVSSEGESFLNRLEKDIASDLWKSAGGIWSEESIQKFRQVAMEKLAASLKGESYQDYQQAWTEVARDFHKSNWGEVRLLKKAPVEKTQEQKIFWELFSYIWILLQAVFVTKTAVFYFGIKSAQEDTTEGKIYVILAVLFSFVSLFSFAYRKSKKNPDKEP